MPNHLHGNAGFFEGLRYPFGNGVLDSPENVVLVDNTPTRAERISGPTNVSTHGNTPVTSAYSEPRVQLGNREVERPVYAAYTFSGQVVDNARSGTAAAEVAHLRYINNGFVRPVQNPERNVRSGEFYTMDHFIFSK